MSSVTDIHKLQIKRQIIKLHNNFLDSARSLSDGRLSAIIDASMFCLVRLIDEAGRTSQVNTWVELF